MPQTAPDPKNFRQAKPYKEPTDRNLPTRGEELRYVRGVTNDWFETTNENRCERITTHRHEPKGTHFKANSHQVPELGCTGVQLDVVHDDPEL